MRELLFLQVKPGCLFFNQLTIDNVNQEPKYGKRLNHRNVCHPERSAKRAVEGSFR